MRITHDLRGVGEAESAVCGTTLPRMAPNERSSHAAGVAAANGYEASMAGNPSNPNPAASGHVSASSNGGTPLLATASWESRSSVR
jgi:hypothetical protein